MTIPIMFLYATAWILAGVGALFCVLSAVAWVITLEDLSDMFRSGLLSIATGAF